MCNTTNQHRARQRRERPPTCTNIWPRSTQLKPLICCRNGGGSRSRANENPMRESVRDVDPGSESLNSNGFPSRTPYTRKIHFMLKFKCCRFIHSSGNCTLSTRVYFLPTCFNFSYNCLKLTMCHVFLSCLNISILKYCAAQKSWASASFVTFYFRGARLDHFLNVTTLFTHFTPSSILTGTFQPVSKR